ncbi:MAG: hypothetical protein JXA93_13925 [Anaerolineae bacterium]|nr:hypothetical protein [Anaerolineae bacterium]
MHYTDRRRAKVAIGLELQARGWTLYGYSEDRSDAMTDYYAPASWQGIAERDGYVAVVDVGPGNRWVLDHSGGFDPSVGAPGDDCPRCAGSGGEPEGWTLADAKADPRAFHRDRARREGNDAVPLMPDVVSPVYFGLNGHEKCIRCHGRGQTAATRTVHVDWPTFRANPERKLWHVEHDGQVVVSGIGLGPCASYDRDEAAAAVKRIVDRMEAATQRPTGSSAPASTTANIEAVTVRRNLERAGVEIVFPAKPDESVRAGLKRLGFRWSGRQGLWYARYSAALWDRVHQFLKLDDASIWQAPEPVPLVATESTTGEATTAETSEPEAIEQVIAEAVALDAVIQASDSGVPAEIADRLNELRGLAFRLDPALDLEEEIRQRRAYDVPKLVRQWRDLTRRLERGHGMRSNTRAAATTKNAHLGKLAQSRDQTLNTLRLVVRRARDRGEPIPTAIQVEPDLARILLDKPEPEVLSRSQAQATLNETMSPANNPAQTLTVGMLDAMERVMAACIVDDPAPDDGAALTRGANRLDEMLARVHEREPVTRVDVIRSPGLQDEHEQRQAAERDRSRRKPAVLMALRATAPGSTNQRLAARGWWWNGKLQIWQHHDPDEGWVTLWYLDIGDHVSGVYDAVQGEVEPGVIDVDGLTWTRHHYDGCQDVAWKVEAEGRYACTIRGDYSGFNGASAPFWHVLYVDTSGEHPEPSSWNGQGRILACIDDGDRNPPARLLAAATELLKLGYPKDLVIDDLVWECDATTAGDRVRYTAERDPWYRYTLIGRPGDWKARWMKPGDLSTTRCFTDEDHAELAGEQDPLTILETLTRDIRTRGNPPPRIEISRAEIVPRETGGWDYYPIVPETNPSPGDLAPEPPTPDLVTPIQAHSGATAYQYSMF